MVFIVIPQRFIASDCRNFALSNHSIEEMMKTERSITMKKEISFSGKGRRADIGGMIIYRIPPNRYTDAVGPFVFLDHIAPVKHSPDKPKMKEGTGAHPHRGIATLTYILNGEGEHFDSRDIMQ